MFTLSYELKSGIVNDGILTVVLVKNREKCRNYSIVDSKNSLSVRNPRFVGRIHYGALVKGKNGNH